jgi:hypothetical protein
MANLIKFWHLLNMSNHITKVLNTLRHSETMLQQIHVLSNITTLSCKQCNNIKQLHDGFFTKKEVVVKN